jgi:flagellar M-ring protein FliF
VAGSPLEPIRAFLDRLTGAQKLRLIVAGLLVTGVLWGGATILGRVRYEVLFSILDPADAAAVVSKLQESKVDYRIEAGGSAISVPAERVAETRLALAGEGIPRGAGVGFEIFDRSTFDVSDFVQNVNYQRALERELGRTIEALDAVSKARVHLVLPARTLFAGEGQEAKASVVVKLFRGRELRAEETLAIAHLIASAVQGLQPEKVSVVDTDGRMLRDGQGDDTVARGQDQLRAGDAVEARGPPVPDRRRGEGPCPRERCA